MHYYVRALMPDVIGIVVLVGVLKLLIETERPLLCATIYALAVAILGALRGFDAFTLLSVTSLTFVLTAGWFLLLNRYRLGSPAWFGILLAGLVLPFVAGALWRHWV
jgi:hypothetical protein